MNRPLSKRAVRSIARLALLALAVFCLGGDLAPFRPSGIPALVDDGYGNLRCPVCGALCDCPYTPACKGRARFAPGTGPGAPKRGRGSEGRGGKGEGAATDEGFVSSGAQSATGRTGESTTGSSETMQGNIPTSLVHFTHDHHGPPNMPPKRDPMPNPPARTPPKEPLPPQSDSLELKSPTL